MSDDPLARPARRQWPRARCVPPRRMDADAGISAKTSRSTSSSSAPAPAAARWPASSRSTDFPSWRFDAGPYFRPLEDFASDESEQTKLYWTDDRIVDGDNPLQMGSNNSGKAVGGSTVHFAMVSLRFRPEWFKSRSLLGYGADWPLDWREMWNYYTEVEQALKIAGPVNYPWGPHRPRYPYRAHELNAAARALAKGCEAMGIKWTETPLATLSAPRGLAHPCVYRGFCVTGCSTNAKQSALVTWIPRAHRGRRRNPRSRDGRQDRG